MYRIIMRKFPLSYVSLKHTYIILNSQHSLKFSSYLLFPLKMVGVFERLRNVCNVNVPNFPTINSL